MRNAAWEKLCADLLIDGGKNNMAKGSDKPKKEKKKKPKKDRKVEKPMSDYKQRIK